MEDNQTSSQSLMRSRDGSRNIFEYTYDVNNRMTKLKHTNSAGVATTDYTYDKDGNETAVGILNSNSWNTVYDKYGRVTSKQWKNSAGTVLSGITYGYPDSGDNLRARPNVLNIGSRKLTYAYDGNGNIISVTDSAGTLTASYQYDERNQLVRENDNSQKKSFVYTYDAVGNLLTQKNGSVTEASHT